MSVNLKISFDDEHAAVPHPPELYQPAGEARTYQTLEDMDDSAIDFYREHGYLAIRQVLDADEIEAAGGAIERLVTGQASGEGDIETMYEAAARSIGIERLSDREKLQMVRKVGLWGGTWRSSGLPVMHPAIVALVRRLLGGREPEPFQVMALLKPAHGGREKPWHQDHAYFNLGLEDRIVGVWIALDEATVENGCMQLLDGGHKLGPMHHWKRRDWQLCDSQIMGRTSVAVPLPPGGALFFDSLLPHGTPTNHSAMPRRAMQFHYAPADAKPIQTEDRMAIFGTEGRDVTC
ncbi:MAG: phytanoyl-CoA dioxygenase family protein [Phycisphaeraceae bacterium]|nr:phytanoyl-CoA dioxygenase family protein [Phycisphaeraceae bacterium]